MSSPDSDSIPTAQFDSLYALSQSTHAMAIGKDFFSIIDPTKPGDDSSTCGWCQWQHERGAMCMLDCQQCGVTKGVCVMCRMDADVENRAGPAAGMCIIAARGCLKCTTPGL